MTYAVRVTPENLSYIISTAADWDRNLDYLEDTMLEYASYGQDCYVVFDGGFETDLPITFTEMTETDFRKYWRFVYTEKTSFTIVDRKVI